MGFYQWYIDIFGSQIHVFSLLAISWCLLSLIYIQKKHPIHIKVINALLVLLLGHFIYEDIFIVIMGTVGRSTDALALYVAITIGITATMVIVDTNYPSFELDVFTLILILVLLVTFSTMYFSGWFHNLQEWYIGAGPDPHNWVWAFSKILGFAVVVPLLKEENLR